MNSRILLGCLIVLALQANAQFGDLACTEDGANLYFSSSLRLKGTSDYSSAKLFLYTELGFELVRQVQCVFEPPAKTNHCQVGQPQISADGRILAYSLAAACTGGSSCLGFQTYFGTVMGASLPSGALGGGGYLRMSRNGRFIARLGANTFGGGSGDEMVDLVQGTRWDIPGSGVVGSHIISDEGALLQGSGIWKAGKVEPLPWSAYPAVAEVSGDGRIVVYATSEPSGCRVFLNQVGTGREIVLAQMPAPCGSSGSPRPVLSLSSSGGTVLYGISGPTQSVTRLMLQNTAGGTARVLAQHTSGFTAAVLSGDAGIVYAATGAGSLLKIRVASGETQELTKPAVRLPSSASWLAPGTRLEIPWSNFDEAGVVPKVLIDGRDAPLVGATGDMAVFQVPWEVEPDRTARAEISSDSRFEQVFEPQIMRASPRFYRLPSEDPWTAPLAAAHEDFRSLVTAGDAAKPEEIVHFFLTGLGRVSPPIATGEVTPVEPLRFADVPFSCFYYKAQGGIQTKTDIDLLFVGLAPGYVGVNQVDMRLPADATGPEFQFECRAALAVGWSSSFGRLPLQP